MLDPGRDVVFGAGRKAVTVAVGLFGALCFGLSDSFGRGSGEHLAADSITMTDVGGAVPASLIKLS